jgi:hypothetical protein
VAGRIAGLVDRRFRKGGASTLATQTEKFRHSPAERLLLPSDAAAYVEAAKTCDNH